MSDITTQCLSDREQLIQEITQAPDDLVQAVLEFLHQAKGNSDHPLAKFAGILSDAEAEELQESIRKSCRQVELNEW